MATYYDLISENDESTVVSSFEFCRQIGNTATAQHGNMLTPEQIAKIRAKEAATPDALKRDPLRDDAYNQVVKKNAMNAQHTCHNTIIINDLRV